MFASAFRVLAGRAGARPLRVPGTARDPTAGFTLAELMIVVVIVAVLSAIAFPSMMKDRASRDGREFANMFARDLQRARMQAIGDRLMISACVDAANVRYFSRPISSAPGCAANTATGIVFLRRLQAKPGIYVNSVTAGTVSNPEPVAFPAILDFNPLGAVKAIGATITDNVVIVTRNDGVATTHPEFDYRIDVRALTGSTKLRENN